MGSDGPFSENDADLALATQVLAASGAGSAGVAPLELLEEQNRRTKVMQTFVTGVEDMAVSVDVQEAFRLVFVRCHFSHPPTGDVPVEFANLEVSLRAVSGEEYNVLLVSSYQRGIGRDMVMVVPTGELTPPSGWTFRAGDALLITWSNPNGARWGLSVGVAYA